MSDAHKEHQSLIKTPKQLIIVVVAAFVIPIFVIVLLAGYVASGKKEGAGSAAMSSEAVAERLAPVAKLELVDANAPKVLKSGEQVYKAVCASCHDAGIAGAPKQGDKAAWSARIAQDLDTLYKHAIEGFQGKTGMMPAKGGNGDLDNVEVQRAVVYMANAAGSSFKEPEAPAPAAPAEAATAPASAAPSADAMAALAAAKADAPAKPAAAPAADAGKKVYDTACMACHTAGIAGAPKFGDKAAWGPRIAQGMETLYTHTIKGFQGKTGVMPPKGGSSASDDDIKAAVRYMVDAAK